MRSARARTVGLALGACLLAGCASPSAAPRLTGPALTAGRDLPPGWGRLKPLLAKAEAQAAAGDLAGLRAGAPAIQAEGLSLLKANLPNVLPPHEIPRFLEGRANFGEALVAYASALEQARDAQLPGLLQRVSDAWHAWMGVIEGLPPERAV